MSNDPHLEAATFTRPTRDPDYGYTICDDYSQAYNDLLEAPVKGDIDLLKVALQNGDSVLDFCFENQSGIHINQTWYDWEEIVQYFGDGTGLSL